MSKLSVYTDVWVVIMYGDSDIHEVYLDKDEAIIECSKKNEDMVRFISIGLFKKPYEVKTLGDALDIIKESVRDDRVDNEDY